MSTETWWTRPGEVPAEIIITPPHPPRISIRRREAEAPRLLAAARAIRAAARRLPEAVRRRREETRARTRQRETEAIRPRAAARAIREADRPVPEAIPRPRAAAITRRREEVRARTRRREAEATRPRAAARAIREAARPARAEATRRPEAVPRHPEAAIPATRRPEILGPSRFPPADRAKYRERTGNTGRWETARQLPGCLFAFHRKCEKLVNLWYSPVSSDKI